MNRRALLSLFALLLLALACLLLSLAVGSVSISPGELLAALFTPRDDLNARVLWELRVPRTLNAFVTGGLLGLAGALMQVLLRNPLSDPYVLGTSGGAAVGALSVILFGLSISLIPVAAFAGALFTIWLVFRLAAAHGGIGTDRLLLTGVIIAAAWGALINLLLAISNQHNVHAMLFWLMGDLSQSDPPIEGGLVLLVCALVAMAFGRDLNVLVRGTLQARSLGVDTRKLHTLIYLLASIATATAVTQAGSIGFVGLVVPHIVRRIQGADHRLLIPSVVLLGGSLLTLADTLARSVISPRQLPVGVLTALIGVPIFIGLLQRNERGSA